MIRKFKIKNFRGFHEFEFNNLAKINLISGKNNVGKTALLEALFLHYGSSNPQLTFIINSFRGGEMSFDIKPSALTPYDSLFFDFDQQKIVELISVDQFNNVKSVKISQNPKENLLRTNRGLKSKDSDVSTSAQVFEQGDYPILDFEDIEENKHTHYQLQITPQGLKINRPVKLKFETHFISSSHKSSKQDAKFFGELDKINPDYIIEIEKTLQIIDKRLKRLKILPEGSDFIIQADIGLNRPLPLIFMGEGMSKITTILLRISHAKNGVVLIDEIENGFHFSILKDVWRAIFDAANKFNVQIFITTHSYESIKAAYLASLETNEENFVLHRLVRVENEIQHKVLDKSKLALAIESHFEVR